MHKKFTAADLFSGAGGLTLGLKQAGFEVLAGIEIEKIPATTYRLNHPDVHCFNKDIREIGAVDLLKTIGLKRGDLDLLAGCPPCQGFSTLRTRKKSNVVADDRNDLLFEFLRIVEAISPRSIMMENVPSLAKDTQVSTFLKRLSVLGYKVGRKNVRVEDASEYGVRCTAAIGSKKLDDRVADLDEAATAAMALVLNVARCCERCAF